MTEYKPQAWRFGDGPNQYYADQYAKSTAMLDLALDYDDATFERHHSEFLADLAAHDRKVEAAAVAQALREVAVWINRNATTIARDTP